MMFRVGLLAALIVSALPSAKTMVISNSTKFPLKTVTVQVTNGSVAEALAAIGKQTGIAVADRRGASAESTMNLHVENEPFWRALDRIAAETKSAISVYQRDGTIALVDGPVAKHVSHSGVFRVTVKDITTSRNLQTGSHTTRVELEIAWQPNFKPLLLAIESFEAEYPSSPQAREVKYSGKGTGQVSVHGRNAINLDISLPASDRSVTTMSSLKGSLSVVGPVKMLLLTAKDLPELIGSEMGRKVEDDGASIHLREFTVLDKNHWMVEVRLTQPKGGPVFQSFQSWLVHNRIWLQSKTDPSVRFVPRAIDEEQLVLTSNEAVVRYHFVAHAGSPELRDPRDWELHFQGPGRIIRELVEFQFANILLP